MTWHDITLIWFWNWSIMLLCVITKQGDQASIIGGAINFVKELEQLLLCMRGQKKTNQQQQQQQENNGFTATPFAEFFMFPQYSTSATHSNTVYPATSEVTMQQNQNKSWAVADIEVSLVDGHANMKILSKKQPGLIVKMVLGLQSLGFTILHLNVTTADDMVLTSVSVKVRLPLCQFLLGKWCLYKIFIR